MKKVPFIIFTLIAFMFSCTRKDPAELISEGDALMKNLSEVAGIKDVNDYINRVKDNPDLLKQYNDEFSRKRERAEELYDQALRRIESRDYSGYSEEEINSLKARANFAIGFLRMMDLIDKLSGLLNSSSSSGGTGNLDISKFHDLIKDIFEKSIFPIIDNYDEALRYGDFSFKFNNLWLDFSGFVSASAGRVVVDLSKKDIDNTDTYFISGVLKGLSGVAEILLAYKKLLSVLLDYSQYFSGSYDTTKIFNMIPGQNPLLNPNFGIFETDGLDCIKKAKEMTTGMFADFRDGFSYLITREVLIDPDQSDDLINLGSSGNDSDIHSYSGGMAWGENLINSIKVNYSPGDPDSVSNLSSTLTFLQGLWGTISSQLNINVLIDMFEDLRSSSDSIENPPFSITYYIYRLGLDSYLPTLHINLENLNLPGIRLAGFFDIPISDLKSVLPLWYLESEPVKGDKDGDGLIDSYGEWVDLNQNGKWDQAGDIISQPEREPCLVNEAGNCSANSWVEDYDDVGILGTFVDRDGDGLPDSGYEGVLIGAGNGKFDQGNDDTLGIGVPIGDILGHYWPDGSKTDPSDGVVENNYYFFFPDPSFHGVLVPVEVNKEKLTYRVTGKAMTNAALNALITNIGSLLGGGISH